MRRNRSARRLGAILFASALLAGCGGGEHHDLRQWMKNTAKGMEGKVPPLPEIKPFPVVAYDAGDLLDPFNPAKVVPEKRQGGGKEPDFDRPREPLEAYPLESLHMIGYMIKNKKPHALIKADKMLYQVTVGNYMGQNFGRIVEIGDDYVKLVELVQDPSGQTADWIEQETSLQLQEKLLEKQEKKK